MPAAICRQEGFHRWGWLRPLICCFVCVLLAAGCGPTRQQLMEMEKARAEAEAHQRAEAEAKRQAEETRRQAEEAKLERIRAAETAGDKAAAQDRFEEALEHYQVVLRATARYGDRDLRVRQAVIKAVRAMPAPPPLPESVMRSMVRGETMVKMGGTGSYEAAAKEMEKAVLDAPWLAGGYYNSGIVQEKAGRFGQASQDLRLYLLAAPNSPNATAIQAKIYELEVKKEDQEKMQALQGKWQGVYANGGDSGSYSLTVREGKIHVAYNGAAFIQVEKKGLGLEGFVTTTGYTDWEVRPGWLSEVCRAPGYTESVAGLISEDGRSMEFRWMSPDYKFTYNDYFRSIPAQGARCVGVALVGKSERNLKLAR